MFTMQQIPSINSATQEQQEEKFMLVLGPQRPQPFEQGRSWMRTLQKKHRPSCWKTLLQTKHMSIHHT
jgi:hypothetical protein